MFDSLETVLKETGLTNRPDCIYNIDESWYDPKSEKNRKIVVPTQNKMPYKTYEGIHPHVSITLCARADGEWVPPMLTF